MRKLLLASVGVLALGVTAASAADIVRPRPLPAKAPIYVEPPFSWTGFYVGINGGYGWGRSNFADPFPTGNFHTSGGLVGGTLGYNLQMNSIVFGLEGDMDWSRMHGNAACAGAICDTRNRWLSTARVRVGYAMGRFMPYVTGGAAFGDIRTSISGVGTTSESKTGWTAGGGIEYAFAGPWSAKLEYLHVDLGRGAPVVPGANAKFSTDIVRAGLNYRF